MSRAPTLRGRTGHRRRETKRNQTRHHRHMHLTHSQACFRSNLQIQTFFHGAAALVKMMVVPHFLFVYNYLLNNNNDHGLSLAFLTLLHMNIATYVQSASNFDICERLDYILVAIYPLPFTLF